MSASLLQQNWLDMNTGKKIDYCQDPIKAAQYWAAVVTEIRTQASTVPGRYMEVRYEDLVSNPKETMMRVLAFLEEPWDSSVLEHQNSDVELPGTESSSEAVSQPVHTASIQKWKSQLDEQQTAQIEKHAGSLLKALGYAA